MDAPIGRDGRTLEARIEHLEALIRNVPDAGTIAGVTLVTEAILANAFPADQLARFAKQYREATERIRAAAPLHDSGSWAERHADEVMEAAALLYDRAAQYRRKEFQKTETGRANPAPGA